MGEPATYRQDLGDGQYLDAFAIDPTIDESGLKRIIESQKGSSRSVLRELESTITAVGHFNSFADLKVEPLDEPYKVPAQLAAYRDALGIKLDAEGKFSGPIAPVDGAVQIPLKLRKGGYYDFMATQLEKVPADLLPELLAGRAEELFIDRFKQARAEEERFLTRYDPKLIDRFRAGTLEKFARERECDENQIRALREGNVGALLEQHGELFSKVFDIEARQVRALQKAEYPAGQTVEDLMPVLGIRNEDRARYLGFAFIMRPGDGKEISLVQRAPGMGIAADCIASSGGTPGFPDSNSSKFYSDHVAQEMGEEYALEVGEFDINGITLFDSQRTLPFGAVEVTTQASTRELAKRIYGNQEAIEEHPILYSMPPESTSRLLDQFNMFPDIAFALDFLDKKRKGII